MHRYVTETRDYLRLFKNAREEETMLGEASAWYLYSKEALANIHEFDPDAKIIAMVRNPINMFASLHGMLLRNFVEDETDLERAWDLQESRRNGIEIPKGRNKRFDPRTWLYADVCKVGAQIDKLFGTFSKHQVHVIMFDDFVRDTKSSYEEVLAFLRVPSDGRISFPPVNVRQVFNSRRLARIIWKLRDTGGAIKRRLGIVRTFNVLEILYRPIERAESRPNLSPEFRKRLIEEFRPDIEQLSSLIERDLSAWWR